MSDDSFTFFSDGRANCVRTRPDGTKSAAGVTVFPKSEIIAKAALLQILDAMSEIQEASLVRGVGV